MGVTESDDIRIDDGEWDSYINEIIKTLFTTDPLGVQSPAHQHNNTSRVACSRTFLILLNLLINISHPAASEKRGEMVEMWERHLSAREGGYMVSYGPTHINTPRAWDVPGHRLLLFLDRHPTTWMQRWWRRLATSKTAVGFKPHYRAGLRFDLSK